MYASNFDYYRARSVAEAHQLLSAHPGAKLLAGGHSLVPLLKLRLATASAVVDIGRIPELRGIARQGGHVPIGGNIAHADPASDLPIVLVALDARMIATGPNGERVIPADAFFTGIMTT